VRHFEARLSGRWENPHRRRIVGPAKISAADAAHVRRLLDVVPEADAAYLVDAEIDEPSRGISHAALLALFVAESVDQDRRAEIASLLEAESPVSIHVAFPTPVGQPIMRTKGLRVL
jgi:hypothetical protein